VRPVNRRLRTARPRAAGTGGRWMNGESWKAVKDFFRGIWRNESRRTRAHARGTGRESGGQSMNSMPEPGAAWNLTPRQKRLVRESFESVREYSDSVALLFYARVFELAPQTRGVFKIGIRERAQKLMATLTGPVDALDRFEKLRPDLAALGRRHAEYKVEPAHYQLLVTALMWAFGQALGIEFDLETRTAWPGTTCSPAAKGAVPGTNTP
jgi:hemoglobin-like flavoprotein